MLYHSPTREAYAKAKLHFLTVLLGYETDEVVNEIKLLEATQRLTMAKRRLMEAEASRRGNGQPHAY